MQGHGGYGTAAQHNPANRGQIGAPTANGPGRQPAAQGMWATPAGAMPLAGAVPAQHPGVAHVQGVVHANNFNAPMPMQQQHQ